MDLFKEVQYAQGCNINKNVSVGGYKCCCCSIMAHCNKTQKGKNKQRLHKVARRRVDEITNSEIKEQITCLLSDAKTS